MEEELWPSEYSDSESEEEVPSERQTAPLPIQQFLIFTLLWQFVFKISNTAIGCLLRFMKHLVRAIGIAFQCDSLINTVDVMPLCLQTVHKLLGISGNDFVAYVVCPSCQSVYRFEDCFISRPFGRSEAKTCCQIVCF